MPVKKRYDAQITTPVSNELKTDLTTIKEELGLSDLTDLVRRVLSDFVDAYYKRGSSRTQVPAVAKHAVLGGGAKTTASIRNVSSVIEKLAGKIDIPDLSTEIPADLRDLDEGKDEG